MLGAAAGVPVADLQMQRLETEVRVELLAAAGTEAAIPEATKCDPHHCPRCRAKLQRKDAFGICPMCKHTRTIMDTQIGYDDKHNTAAATYSYDRMGNLTQQLLYLQCKQTSPPLWLLAETMITLMRLGLTDRHKVQVEDVKRALKINGRTNYYKSRVKIFCILFGFAPLRFSYNLETMLLQLAAKMMPASSAQGTTARSHFRYNMWMHGTLRVMLGLRRATPFLQLPPLQAKHQDSQIAFFNDMARKHGLPTLTAADLQ